MELRKKSGFPLKQSVGKYDKNRELIIDPVVLAYSTFLGGSSSEYCEESALDNNGNVYVTGYTNSTDFPVLNEYQGNQPDRDVFVARLDPGRGGTSTQSRIIRSLRRHYRRP